MTGVNRLPDLMNRLLLGREMNDYLGQWLGETGRRLGLNAYPAVNVWEDTDAFHVEAELPGLKREDLQITVAHRTQVTIAGEHKAAPGEFSWHRRERLVGKFERVLTFPAPLDADKVEAKLENGVLHLTLPKAAEARPRRIQVNAG
jgi:HSP20 family protein